LMKKLHGAINSTEHSYVSHHNTQYGNIPLWITTSILTFGSLSKMYNVDVSKNSNDALVGETKINGEKVIFAKPTTFMNLSGNSVVKLKNWYKVQNKDILIIFDDIDIPFETFRYREKGSGGSHNGMKNIVQMLSTEDIPRIRIGLGGLKHEKQF